MKLVCYSASLLLACALSASAGELIPSAAQRYQSDKVQETPDFQRHVLPLMGRLGCNGRACHGSFQGQGGFRLSLFGYDFKADHAALSAGEKPRVDLTAPEKSLILLKPTEQVEHGGGQIIEKGSWEYRLLERWIEAGAPANQQAEVAFDRLEVSPPEIVFSAKGQTETVKVIAHWSDGTQEVVTPLCRFRTNDESTAEIDEAGTVTAIGPGDTHVVVFYENGVAPIPVLLPVTKFHGPNYPKLPAPTPIDQHVATKLQKLGVLPSDVCTDAEFLRRVRLDMTGTLPSVEEVNAFLADKHSDKRSRKIDELLDSPEYAAWWATKFGDVLGNNANTAGERFLGKEQAELWFDWLYRRLDENVSYDKIVAGIVLATSRKEGQSYREYVEEHVAYYRAKDPADFTAQDSMPFFWSRRTVRDPKEKALSFAHAFLGVRLQCAECHKHPFDQWTQQDFQQFTAFFEPVVFGVDPNSRDERKALEDELNLDDLANNEKRRAYPKLVKEGKPAPLSELYINNRFAEQARRKRKQQKNVQAGRVITPRVLGGEEVVLQEYPDPREPLMQWLRDENNPYFAKAIVNRIWSNYFGVGIIDPADDMNLANPPSNEALMDYLTTEFIAHGYDLKWLHREITNSLAYQRSCQPNETNLHDRKNFSHALLRRLPAEVAFDALVSATAGEAELAEFHKEVDERKIGPESGMITRNRAAGDGYMLEVFGKPAREVNCDCERSDEPSLLQTVFLRNDRQMLSMLDRRGGWIDEVRRSFGRAPANREVPASLAKRIEAAQRQVATLQKQLKQAKQAGDNEKADRLKNRLGQIQKKIAQANKQFAPAPKNRSASSLTMTKGRQQELIEEAFLRTVNRPPTVEELAQSRNYLTESEDPLDGLRDLMWALLNTKEFIINH